MIKKALLAPFMVALVPTVITIIFGLLLGLVLLLLTVGDRAIPAFQLILTGGFTITGFSNGVSRMIFYVVPIMMTGLSVGLAMKTGVFNIGATGQLLMGMFAGIYIGLIWEPALGAYTWVAALIGGAFLGGVWGLIQGALQAYKKVNAIVCGIMMNFIGLSLVNIMIVYNGDLYVDTRDWTHFIPRNGLLPTAGLNRIFVGGGANSGVLFGIAFCIIVFFILEKTTRGYEMKACGLNNNAAKYAGINVEKNVMISMALAGAVAGLGGMMFHNGTPGQAFSLTNALRPEGFTGIPVALLAAGHPIGIIFSSLFIAYLQTGGLGVQALGVEADFVSVITAVIIFSCSFNLLIRKFYIWLIGKVFDRKQ